MNQDAQSFSVGFCVDSTQVPLESWLGVYLCYLTFMYMCRPVLFQAGMGTSPSFCFSKWFLFHKSQEHNCI